MWIYTIIWRFNQFAKVDVNGENESLVFKSLDPDYKNNGDIKWNFSKFIVDREESAAERYESTVNLKKIEERIVELLG